MTGSTKIFSHRQVATHYARRPYPTILRITCLVKAFCTPRGARLASVSAFIGDRAREDGMRGDPSVVRYPGGSSSSSKERISSPLPSAALSAIGNCAGSLLNGCKSHFPASRPRSLRCLSSWCVSSRNKIPIVTPQARIIAQIKLGKRYGNLSKIVPRENTDG